MKDVDVLLFKVNNGKDFKYLHQRIIYDYAMQMSPYNPVRLRFLSEESQRQYYDFLCEFYQNIYDNPDIIDLDTLPDEAEDKRVSDSWKETSANFKSILKKINTVFEFLTLCGQLGEVYDEALVINKKELKFNRFKQKKFEILMAMGFDFDYDEENVYLSNYEYPDMMKALKYLAAKCQNGNFYNLTNCVFDNEYVYQPEVFASLTLNKDFYYEILNYIKNKDFLITPKPNEFKYEAKKEVDGHNLSFICEYRPRKYYQFRFIFTRDLNVFKTLLSKYHLFDEKNQRMVMNILKKSSTCSYCNRQTRNCPMKIMMNDYNGERLSYCPYLKEISLGYLDESVNDLMIEFFDFFISGANDEVINEKCLTTTS